jgi:hypothetical protein
MNAACRLTIASGLLFLTWGVAAAGAQLPGASGRDEALPLDGPTQLDPIPPAAMPPADADNVRPEDRVLAHEAVEPRDSRSRSARQLVRKEPPAMITERPSSRSADRKAQWVPGYWDWDQAQNDFVWVGGTWQVAPAGSMWVAGRWMRDSEGWYRVPGFWSRRRDAGARPASSVSSAPESPAWRRSGPPTDHPDDSPAVAPGPDYFYIAGQYVPDGENVTWKPGFWARVQPGWDWVPSRWVRRSDGWNFRPGSWVRETGALAQSAEPGPRSTIRPLPGESPSSAVDQEARASSPDAAPEVLPPAAGVDIEGGTVPGTELPGGAMLAQPQSVLPPAPGAVVVRDPRAMFFGTVTRMPYYVVRPPGYFPYGPAGVIVPGVVPQFVRNILDRVLP